MRKTLETAVCGDPAVLKEHYEALAAINATCRGSESWRGRQGLLVDTVMQAGRDLYPRLRPHLLRAIDNDDTVMDDILLALLDQLMGYDEIHRGRGVLVGYEEAAPVSKAAFDRLATTVRRPRRILNLVPFIEECCVLESGSDGRRPCVPALALYEAYLGWCAASGMRPLGRLNFTRLLLDQFDAVQKVNGDFVGLRLATDPATLAANATEDQVRLFLEQRCLRGPHLQVRFAALYEAYAAWAADRNSLPVGLPAFVEQLAVVDPELDMVPAGPPGELAPGAEPTLQGLALRLGDDLDPLDQWEVFRTDQKPQPAARIRWNMAALPERVGQWLSARCEPALAFGGGNMEEPLLTLWADYGGWCDDQGDVIEWGSMDLMNGLVLHLEGVEAVKHPKEGSGEIFLRGIRLKAFAAHQTAAEAAADAEDLACGVDPRD